MTSEIDSGDSHRRGDHRNGTFKVSRIDLGHEQPFKPRRFKLSDVDSILKENQEDTSWGNWKHIEQLRSIAGKLILGLPIEVKDGKTMDVPLFAVAEMNRKCFGRYDPHRNAIGISGVITVNEVRLSERRMTDRGIKELVMKNADVALHLTMLLTLCWRHQTGGSGNLDDVVRKKLRSFGLKLGKRHIEGIDEKGAFALACSSQGIGDPPIIVAVAGGQAGRSTNRLYSCNCQKVRVGRGKFFAHCPMCGREFLLGDHVGKYPEGTNVTDTPLADRRED